MIKRKCEISFSNGYQVEAKLIYRIVCNISSLDTVIVVIEASPAGREHRPCICWH